MQKKELQILGQWLDVRHWWEGGGLILFPWHLLGRVLLVVVLLLKRLQGVRHWVGLHVFVLFWLVVSVRFIPEKHLDTLHFFQIQKLCLVL